MKKQLIILLSLSILFFSCQKDDINVTLNQSGTIDVKVIDNNNKGIEGAEVRIGYSSYSNLIFEGETNSSGVCKTGKLLQGTYICYAETSYNKVTYSDSKTVQIIAGENKAVEINPLLNSGTALITLRPYYGSINVSNLNVALMPYNDYYDISIDKIEALAHFIGKTNTNGTVQITDVPTSIDYRVLVYDNNKLYYSYNNSFYARRGETSNVYVEIYTY